MATTSLPAGILSFVEFLAQEKNPVLVPTVLEAVRNLPVIKDGQLFSVREHIRANAMGRNVVIKIFKRSLSPGTTNAPADEELGRILKEIRILSCKSVALHDNLVNLESVEFGIHSGDPFEICPALVLEKAPYGSLDGFLKIHKSLKWQMKKSLCHDIASALDCLHGTGILHGDLNPSHVLIFDHPERQFVAKLTGFSDSQILTKETSINPITLGGSKPLRAPEIEEGSTALDQSLKTDVFSAGLLFWSILVNQDFFETFDLPLDKTFRDNDIMDVLRLPYLYRFIPLLVEHDIGLIEDQEFQMLQKLFACTVRLSPRCRDLKEVLRLLGSGDEQTSTARNKPHDNIIESVDLNFNEIKVSVNVLKSLPYPVPKQYLRSLEALHQAVDLSAELAKSATWTESLCHLYGYGTQQNPGKATEILAKCLQGEGKFAELAEILVPVLRQALSIELNVQETRTAQETLRFEKAWDGKVGPWVRLGQSPAVSPKEHGLNIELDDAMLWWWSEIQENNDVKLPQCGSSNTLLHVFAIYGLLEQVKYLIEQVKLSVNVTNDRGETPLLLACRYGSYEIATYLLNHDADASIMSKSRESGLHWLSSIPSGHLGDLSLKLVEKGARLLSNSVFEDQNDWTSITPGIKFLIDGRISGDPLLQAVANRDGTTLRLLLYLIGGILSTVDARVQLLFLITRVLERPFQLACELHLFDIVELLIQEFKRMFLEPPEAAIPPSQQAFAGSIQTNPRVAGILFVAGLESISPFGAAIDMSFHVHRLCYHREDWKLACKTTLAVLIKNGFLTKLLKTEERPYTALAYAVRCGNDEALNFLLELEPLKARIDDADNGGYTLVHHAIEARQFNALLILKNNGVTLDLRKKKDPNNCLNGVGASYLHVLGSVRCDDLAFIQLFLDDGVPATICDNRGISALSLALTRGAFTLASALIDEGASIVQDGIFGVTSLGELFIPSQANQHDDLFSTFKFLFAYRERGMPIFIASQQLGYSIIHAAAAHYRDDELYSKIVDTTIQSFRNPDMLEVPANTPAKSTALQMAIGMYNPIVVKALVNAGVSLHDKDTENRTPLDYAVELLYRLVNLTDSREDSERIKKLERISTIILLLSEKAGWPKEIEQFPKLLATFDEAEVLLTKMMCSEHQVAFMRHLERVILALVGKGYADMLNTMSLHHLDLVRRISMKRLQPALRMDLEYRVIPHDGFTNPSESFDSVKKAIPWCLSLTNNYIQDFQLAATFEWLLDLIQRNALPEGRLKAMAEDIKKYAFSGKRSDLKIDQNIARYPYTLLQWYERAISDDALVLGEKDRAQIQRFMQTLRERREARIQRKAPLPPFNEEFTRLHFDKLHPERLDPEKAVASIMLVTRCRCFFDRIGLFSRFQMMRMCQRMTSVDNEVFSRRLSKMRVDAAKEVQELCEWKSKVGLTARRTLPVSTMKWIFVDEKFNRTESLLAHPENYDSGQQKDNQNKAPKQNSTVPIYTVAKSTFPYKPLDFDKNEIRLLKILPESGQKKGFVCCEMGHFSVAPTSYTEEYRDYEQAVNKHKVRPVDYHTNWKVKNSAKRFVWGDFSCLSYTWGDPHDTRTIVVNGHEVTVRSNLEAALRSFRQQDEFKGGLMLWTDALCINQEDIGEKEKTIRDMQNIYLGANTVTVWLGAGSSETDTALQTVRNLVARYSKPSEDSTDVRRSEIFEPPPLWFSSTVYPAIAQLMDRPYWRRLWIMQEITACAPCENIYLGDHSITWNELVLLLKFCMTCRNAMNLNDEYTEKLNNRVLANIKQAYVLTSMAESYRHLSGLGKLNTSVRYGNSSSWTYLGGTAEVTDERDRVYGILGLVPENISSLIMPNYAKSVEEVYQDLSKALIVATGSFDESFSGSITDNKDLPSWAMNIRDTSGSRPKNGRAGGYPNPYDGFLKTGRMYRITVRKKPTPDDPNPDENNDSAHYEFSDDGKLLTIVGVFIDTVEGISGSVVKHTIPTKILEAPWKPSERPLNLREGVTARETILRVMSADATYADEPDGSILDIPFFDGLEPDATLVEDLHNNGWSDVLRSDQFRVFHQFRIRKGEFPLFEGKMLQEWFTTKILPCNEDVIMKAMECVSTVSQRTFITTEKGNLGSTGVAVKEGDRIFVALGCSYPILTRPDGDMYRIIGECYLDGFADGEALDMVKNGELEIGKIQIR